MGIPAFDVNLSVRHSAADADSNVLLISCAQSAFVEPLDMRVRQADRDRTFKRRAVLEPLSREQVDALILQRLDSVEPLRELRARNAAARYYLFDERFLHDLSRAAPCVPRRVIAAARCGDERAQPQRSAPCRGGRAPPSGPARTPARWLEV